MQLKIYTSKDLAYANRRVFKSVISEPDAIVNVKHFDFRDMINSSIVLSDREIPVKPEEITYIIIIDDDKEYHYFTTSLEFLSKGKFRLGLYRNAWVDIDLSNTVGTIIRGTTADKYHIANYKSNSMTVNRTKVREVYITDEFTEQSGGVITKPTAWGILYTAQLDEEADNPYINLDTPPYVVSGDTKFEDTYYRDFSVQTYIGSTWQTTYYSYQYKYTGLKDRLLFMALTKNGNRNTCRAYFYDMTYDICYNTNYRYIYPTKLTLIQQDTFANWNTIKENVVQNMFYIEAVVSTNDNITPAMVDNFVNTYIKNCALRFYRGSRDFNNIIGWNTDNTIINRFGEDITIGGTTYKYQSEEFVNSQEGAIVKVGDRYYNTTVLRSTDTVNYSVQQNIDLYTAFNIIYKEMGSISKAKLQEYIQDLINFILNNSYAVINNAPAVIVQTIGYQYQDRVKLNFGNGTTYFNQVVLMHTQSYSYNELDNFSVELDKTKINNGLIISQPYGIIAIPLFDIRYKLNGVIKNASGSDNQKVFYKLINKYSGGSNPFIIDAQIIPYAPTIFKQNRKTDNGVYIDYTNLTDIIANKSSTYSGVPIIMLNSADITVNKYVDLNPYEDIQKEYTLRSYRLQSPGQDAAFDFKYYDYNRYGVPFIEYINNVPTRMGDTMIQIDITLKPFGLYMHASPYVRDNALVANKDYDEIKGLVCGAGVFESTLTSSAYETYRRENSMFSDIQERRIESLNIEHNTERTNETWAGVIGTIQATALGAMAGDAMFGRVGAMASGAIAGAMSGGAFIAQYNANETLRQREIEDAWFYYKAQLQTIKNLPNTVNRVSQLNQDILNHFCVYIEVYDATSDENVLYDTFVENVGNRLEINDTVSSYLINGKYIQGRILKSNLRQDVFEAIRNDFEKGVYYYEQV